MSKKRLVAKRVKIQDITGGKYFKQEGFTPNYLITDQGFMISRVAVIATIVDTYKNDAGTYGAITFDDGTDTIRAKYFQDLEPMDTVSPGQIVEIIGKVKEYGDEIYVVAEQIFQRDANYELLRNVEYQQFLDKWLKTRQKIKERVAANASLESIINEFGKELTDDEIKGLIKYFEIESQFSTKKEIKSVESSNSEQATQEEINQEVNEDNNEKLILALIEKLDEKGGAEYSEIIKNSKLASEEVESIINNLLSDGTCYEPRPGKIKRL